MKSGQVWYVAIIATFSIHDMQTNGNGENRFFCIYNILVEQRAEKVAAEQKQKAEKREFVCSLNVIT